MSRRHRIEAIRWVVENIAAKAIAIGAGGSVAGLFGLHVGEPVLVDLALASGVVAVTPAIVCLVLLWGLR